MADDPTPDLILDKQPDSPTTITLGTGTTLVLLGILVVLGGILYVLIRHTGVFEPSPRRSSMHYLERLHRTINNRGAGVRPSPQDSGRRTIRP